MTDAEIRRLGRSDAAYNRGDFAAALREIMPLVKKSNSDAQNFLGLLYYEGKGLKKDPARAIEWYRRAAEQGNSDAQFNLAVMYDEGFSGGGRNPAEAAKWYRLAAQQDDEQAQFNLGMLCYQGDGVPRDYKHALTWWRRAAVQGNPRAQNNVGYMFQYGLGVQKDSKEANKCIEKLPPRTMKSPRLIWGSPIGMDSVSSKTITHH